MELHWSRATFADGTRGATITRWDQVSVTIPKTLFRSTVKFESVEGWRSKTNRSKIGWGGVAPKS